MLARGHNLAWADLVGRYGTAVGSRVNYVVVRDGGYTVFAQGGGAGYSIDANLWGIGWRLVFLINVPIGALTWPLAAKALPRGASHPGVKLDVVGVGLVGLALVAIIYPLIQGRGSGWPAWAFLLLGAGAVGGQPETAYSDSLPQILASGICFVDRLVVEGGPRGGIHWALRRIRYGWCRTRPCIPAKSH